MHKIIQYNSYLNIDALPSFTTLNLNKEELLTEVNTWLLHDDIKVFSERVLYSGNHLRKVIDISTKFGKVILTLEKKHHRLYCNMLIPSKINDYLTLRTLHSGLVVFNQALSSILNYDSSDVHAMGEYLESSHVDDILVERRCNRLLMEEQKVIDVMVIY